MNIENQIQTLEFSENRNGKLLCDSFLLITPKTKNFRLNEKYYIRLKERFFCYAKPVKKTETTLQEIINMGLYLLDGHTSQSDFIKELEKEHSGKKWWNGLDTKMNLWVWSKHFQIDLFDYS